MPKKTLLAMLAGLLLVPETAALTEEVAVKIKKFRTENKTWYDCKSGEKKTDSLPWVAREFPWQARVLSNGLVEVMDESGKPSTYCVRGFTVETVTEADKPVTVKAKQECGPVVAQRTGATRGLGEDCPKGKAK